MRDETALRPHGMVPEANHLAGVPAEDPPVLPPVSLLALQFLAWVAAAPRTHADVMDAWRSTCPRQSVWEDTVIDGLVEFEPGTRNVILTALGSAVLKTGRNG
jgi:hypothetical protein